MKLHHDGQVFYMEMAYEERHHAKAASFRWDPDKRRWWTDAPGKAAMLAAFADEQARLELVLSTVTSEQGTALLGRGFLPYQVEAVRFAVEHLGTLLADEMGLGKTAEAIAVMDLTGARKVLVVAPLSVKAVWQAELAKWSGQPRTVGLATAKDWPEGADVVVVHPEVLARQEEQLLSATWDLVVVDEAHFFKDYNAVRTQVLFGSPRRGHPGVTAKRRLCLTGTPVPNRPREIYSVLNWLTPRQWGSKHTFEERYCDGGYIGGYWGRVWDADGASNLGELHNRLRAEVMVRHLKADVLAQLPPKRHNLVAWRPEDVGTAAVRALRNERKVLAKAGVDLGQAGWAAKVKRLEARGGGDGAALAKARHETALAKAPAVVAYVAAALEDDPGKVVVWVHHHDVADIVANGLAPYGVALVDGRTDVIERARLVERFQADPSCRTFVGGLTATGTGITLTAASHVVFAELDWRPGVLVQAEDRCHRIGQPGYVLVEHLLVDESIEAYMAKVVLKKAKVQAELLDQGKVA